MCVCVCVCVQTNRKTFCSGTHTAHIHAQKAKKREEDKHITHHTKQMRNISAPYYELLSEVAGTHPEATEHSVSRWLSCYMNAMKSHGMQIR